jgi:hypothetical protein
MHNMTNDFIITYTNMHISKYYYTVDTAKGILMRIQLFYLTNIKFIIPQLVPRFPRVHYFKTKATFVSRVADLMLF